MSLFDFPRINFQGTIQLNPGTANNDDYANGLTLPSSYGPYAGSALGLMDSKMVQARTFGMSDEDFISWVQQPQTFDVIDPTPGTPTTQQQIPAEWNYYGGMDSRSVQIAVTGVQTGPGQDATGPLASLVGASLGMVGVISDVNSEGSPPSTQFFYDSLKLTAGGATVLEGRPNKGACQWINFYRNVSQVADAGAGGYIYHILPKSECTVFNIPGFDAPNVVGMVFRYYLYRPIPPLGSNDEIAGAYKKGQINPVTLQIVGTFAPLYDTETIFTGPVGRLMVAGTGTAMIPTPGMVNNSPNGMIALAPAVLAQNGNIISADFSGTFPDQYNRNPSLSDPKFDFGDVALMVSAAGTSVPIGAVNYLDVATGNKNGWIFDFDISQNRQAQQVLTNPDAVFSLDSQNYSLVLAETDHYFVSNQQGVYAEQFGSGSVFRNQGTEEPMTFQVYSRGLQLTAAQCPPVTVWSYASVPLQAPGNAVAISTTAKPGDPIVVDTSQPGNFLITFSTEPSEVPPPSYLEFMNAPYITNLPLISLRILPNTVDFSQYYVDPTVPEPVGNELLTFDVVYQNVLRTYYLLFPVMSMYIQLNSEQSMTTVAPAILARTDTALWMTKQYMPPTRDMSLSRRTLLRAWCRKVMAAKSA